MKKITYVVLVSWLLLVASTASASIIFIEVTEVYDDLGDTTVQVDSDGNRLRVNTLGLGGAWTVDCGGNAACINTGLDGVLLDIDQDLQLEANLGNGKVNGRTRGLIINLSLGITKFKAQVKGDVICIGEGPDPCQLMVVEMQLKGALFSGDGSARNTGKVDLSLLGTLSLGDGVAPPNWTELDGAGELGIRQ